MNSKIGFWLRRTAAAFEPVCIAQLVQVVLLRRQLRLVQMQGASLLNSQFLNSFVHIARSCKKVTKRYFSEIKNWGALVSTMRAFVA